jgi:tRNA pseudouridine38-40 synthase
MTLTGWKPTTSTKPVFDRKYYLCRNFVMSNRYFIFLSFKGTNYHGWQIQPGSVSVQEIIDKALSLITGEKISTTGAGRTDAGVHASFYCAHFDTDQGGLAEWKNITYRINSYLPSDISITGIRKVRPETNARFSAISRTYKYFITTKKDPFVTDTAWYIPRPPDIVIMNRASSILLSENDFTSFARLHSDNKTNICKIFSAFWKTEDDKIIFTIKADRFLRNMVRAIVGTMAEVGRGKIDIADFYEIIRARNRSAAGTSAPARGLFLTDIEYPDGIYLNDNSDYLMNNLSLRQPGKLQGSEQEIIK